MHQKQDELLITEDFANEYHWVQQDCPVCEVPPTKFLGRRGGSAHRSGSGVTCDVWRCGQCGLIFPNPMPVPVRGMNQHYTVDADVYFQHHDKDTKQSNALSMLKKASELTGGKGRILDIGTGRGELLKTAIEAGWDCVGIEPSASFAEYAANFSGAKIRREPIEACDFPDSSFDVVIVAAVLEHLYNPDETIREIARSLRHGGALFLDVPNEQGLYFQLGNLYQKLCGRDWVVNLAPTFPPFHLFGFGGPSLRRLLEKHGLRPAVLHFYGGSSVLDSGGTTRGSIEVLASRAVTAVSNIGNLGTYIEAWAIKQ
jgi:SAM-dependent methyltransferase